MNVQKELEFLKEVSLGLFDKKYVEFELKTRPYENARGIEIFIRDSRYTKVGNNLDLYISYRTDSDKIYTRPSIPNKTPYVPKEDAASHITSALLLKGKEYGSSYSNSKGNVDFYNIIEQLSDQIFTSPDFFELNISKKSLSLYKSLDLEYGSLIDPIKVYGGVGFANNVSDLNQKTTAFEFGKSPKDDKYYLGIFSNIVENPKRPAGTYSGDTIDLFIETLLEQFKGAWNRTEKA